MFSDEKANKNKTLIFKKRIYLSELSMTVEWFKLIMILVSLLVIKHQCVLMY